MSVIDDILRREGGYVQHEADRGGPTNWGVTMKTLASWRGHPVTAADVRALSEGEARVIYAHMYVAPFVFVNNPPLQELLIDSAVHHGTGVAIKFLQEALGGLRLDGVAGPLTRGAYDRCDPRAVRYAALAARARYYGRIITGNPSQAVFAAGWLNRLAEFITP